MFHWWCLLSVSRYSHKYVVLDCSAQLSSEIIINHVQDVHLGRRNYHYLLSGLVSLVVSNWMLPIHIGQWWPVRRRRKGGHMSLFFQASNRATDDGPAFNALLAQQCIQDDPAAAGDGHGFFTHHFKYKRIFSPSLVIIRPYYVFRRKKKPSKESKDTVMDERFMSQSARIAYRLRLLHFLHFHFIQTFDSSAINYQRPS